jgi:hypothetical protein
LSSEVWGVAALAWANGYAVRAEKPSILGIGHECGPLHSPLSAKDNIASSENVLRKAANNGTWSEGSVLCDSKSARTDFANRNKRHTFET